MTGRTGVGVEDAGGEFEKSLILNPHYPITMININHTIQPPDLKSKLRNCWTLSAEKIWRIEKEFDKRQGSPVFTIKGKYTTRGWTEWTQGFQYGSAILQFDATREKSFLEYGRKNTLDN